MQIPSQTVSGARDPPAHGDKPHNRTTCDLQDVRSWLVGMRIEFRPYSKVIGLRPERLICACCSGYQTMANHFSVLRTTYAYSGCILVVLLVTDKLGFVYQVHENYIVFSYYLCTATCICGFSSRESTATVGKPLIWRTLVTLIMTVNSLSVIHARSIRSNSNREATYKHS